MKHNKYFKTQLAAAAAIAFVSCYSLPPVVFCHHAMTALNHL